MVARWVVVVPVKATGTAKSRLQVGAAERAALARAFVLDTVGAALACPAVRRTVVVTDDRALAVDLGLLGASVLERSLGLNAAVTEAAHRETGPVAALPADLPALRPDTLAAALTRAERCPVAVVPDRRGQGTVLLTALDADALVPQFGRESFSAHRRAGAAPLSDPAWSDLRCDVDTTDDLATATALGLGPHTAAVLRG